MKNSLISFSSVSAGSRSSTGSLVSFLVLTSCLLSFMLSGCRTETPPARTDEQSPSLTESPSDTEPSPSKGSVSIEIVSPKEAKSEAASEDSTLLYEKTSAVAAGTTLEEVMRKIETPKIEISGSGVTAFVQSIDGVANQGTRGWTFTLDDDFATEGIGTTKLTPGQTVQWRFTSLEEAMAQTKSDE